jgi:polysaccharide chain length determinant protein (PEP-CTERM system associated)
VLPGRIYGPEEIVRILWRSKWLILMPFVVCASVTALVTDRLPNRYRSDTLILVVPQRVPESYVRSTVSGSIEDRLQSLRHQILSRSRLERIILDLNLYQEERGGKPFEALVAQMRAAVKVDTVRDDAFTVGYIAHDPRIAQAVTERLASLFIEENLRDREMLAVGTSEFLQTQLDDARKRLVEQEKKLEAYRLAHAGEMPSQAASNLQGLQNAQSELRTVADSIQRHRDRQGNIERELSELLTGEMTDVPVESAPAPKTVADQLEEARAKLKELQVRLTAAHPDVVRQQRTVAQLTELAAIEAQRPAPPAPAPAPTRSAAQIARDRRIRDLRAQAEVVKREIAFWQMEEQRVRQQLAEYQARLEAIPVRESEMTELTRDYETLQELYRTLLAKREDSKIAANLERRQVGEQFRILDPARVPEQPYSPNRLLLNVAGAVLGLALGMGFVALREYLDVSFRNEDEIRTHLSLPVIARIPDISPRRKWLARWRRAA